MHFLDSWTEMPILAFVRMMLPALLLAVAVFLPGRRAARVTAALVALTLPFLPGVGLTPLLRAGWVVLWAAVAWRAGAGGADGAARSRPGGVESGVVGLPLALALFALLVAAVARQDLSADLSRQSSYGLLLMCVGLLHLMLRRDALRATLAFAALGLGLQVLERAARPTLLAGSAPPPAWVLLCTAIAVGLADRLARVRARNAVSTWVSDAHDLHD